MAKAKGSMMGYRQPDESRYDQWARESQQQGAADASSPDDSGGCFLFFGGIVLIIGIIAGGYGTGVGPFGGDDTPDFREPVTWQGRYECRDDTLGVRMTTSFTGSAEDGVAPMTLLVDVFEDPPESLTGKAGGERLGRFERTGSFSEGIVTLDEFSLADDAERFEPSAGRLRIMSNDADADSISGRLRAPGCDSVSAIQNP